VIAVPKSLIEPIGSSNIPLKNPVTVPKLSDTKLIKSLKAKDSVSKVVAKKSTAF